jgi:LuxR family transcriptional regulator, maltose regulon positive regulatory protein
VDGSTSLRASAALVDRPRLLGKLAESSATVVLLNAPSGYGKSVLLEQWSERDGRPFVSVLLGPEHNDPALLAAAIVAALERVETVQPDIAAALAVPEPGIESFVLPRLAAALAGRQSPLVLILDDLEQLESPQSLSVVATVCAKLAPGSQVALATRTEPALPLGRLRAHRRLAELSRADLTMNKAECAALLSGLGLELTPKQLDVLVGHTEGWPAALYLAGLALGEAHDLGRAIARFAGDDRIVVDYISEEFLVPVSRRRLEFLRRASVLDRLSGPLCDAVLGRTGSATVLRDLSRSNMLLVSLDRQDEWFRFHALFREMLGGELRRAEPAAVAELNRRASDWWSERGDWDRAIDHAIEAGAITRAGELLWAAIPAYMTRGRNSAILACLRRLGDEAVASDAALSLTMAFAHITRGAGADADHWAAVGKRLLGPEEPSAKKEVLTAGLALVEAGLSRDGVGAMSARCETAAQLLPDESPWLSMSCLLDGVGLHLRGSRRPALEALSEGARRGSVGAPNVQVLCLAQMALLAIEDDDWQLAEMLASQARAQIDRSGLVEYPMMALALAVSTLVRSRVGMVEQAGADLRLARALLAELDQFAPWYEIETRIVLARAAARLGEARAAAELLAGASRLLRGAPDAVVLGEWIEATAATVEAASAPENAGLTPAELRLLQFFPTHLSFPQIAAQLFVSPNTVKTQAQSIYRKLGASSRRTAVELAEEAGLLGDDPA